MSAGAFRCGHPRTPDNVKIAGQRALCRECHRETTRKYRRRTRAAMTPEEKHLAYRVRYLPTQLEHARRRVEQLENEARRFGFHDLVQS